MIKNYDKYKRMEGNLNRALPNEVVANYTNQYYSELRSLLVNTTEDEDIFQDTFIKLTYKYNPEEPFKD